MGLLLNLAIVFLSQILALYIYIQWKFAYWKRRGLPHHKSNFPLGLYKFRNPENKHFIELIKEQYDYFKSKGHKHFGMTLGIRPVYVPIHPELLKTMMIEDFNIFAGRGFYHNEKDDPLNVNLLTLEGQKWKDMREKISPIFSSSKVKMLFEYVLNSGNRMTSTLDELSKIMGKPVDMKKITSSYITDVVGSCIFGIDCNSCEDDQNEFKKHVRAFFSPLTVFRKFQWLIPPLRVFRKFQWLIPPLTIMFEKIKWLIAVFHAKLGQFFKISLTPREVTTYFLRLVADSVQFREKTNLYRPDIMQLLIELKNKGVDGSAPNKDDKIQNLTMLELTAQSLLFFNASMQTTAATITFCLYELTRNLEIQEQLRKEINNIIDKYDGRITYENIMEMTYLHQVYEEILRMYPSLYMTTRECGKDYQVPNSDVTIEKGTLVLFPISALHRDADFFPEPDKFDPERFNKINKPKIQPFTYLPFGEGPRYCIASRFGDLQVKVGIVLLLRHFRFYLSKRTASIKLDSYMPLLAFDGPAWFNIEKV